MLASRYVLERQLAVGGMGGVHVAMDQRLGRRVAVKLLREDLAASHEFVERFRREAHMVAGLNHPNIAQVFDYGQDGRAHFIVMELVEGADLARLLAERHRLAPAEVVDIAGQVCAALAAAHRAGVVHRDIKPGNVIIGPEGHVKVTDFGIARALGEAPLTQTGSVMGTAQYLPPEQSTGQPATPASDLYSLGVLIYQMLTGEVPFTGDSPVAVAVRHVSEDVPPPSALVPDVPRGLDAVVARATAKQPVDRYASAEEMAAALRESVLPATAWAMQGSDSRTTTVLPALAAPVGGQGPVSGPTTARLPVAAAPATRAARRQEAQTGTSTGPSRRLLVAAGAGVLALIGLFAFTGGEDPAQHPAAPVVGATTAPATSSTPTPTTTTTTARPTPKEPVVPGGLVGRDWDDVEDLLKGLGYRVQKVEFGSERPKDSVLATIPSAGRELAAGQTVVVVISKGEEDRRGSGFVVPEGLVGQRARDIERQLRGEARVSMVQVRSSREPGTVVATWPRAGTTSETGRLLLFVASGGDD
ncbi:MAG TPA: protein kinase [Dermatophilaceae bacterium]|nr:protein kinase [Dermatophilaceae bacterium]